MCLHTLSWGASQFRKVLAEISTGESYFVNCIAYRFDIFANARCFGKISSIRNKSNSRDGGTYFVSIIELKFCICYICNSRRRDMCNWLSLWFHSWSALAS